MLLSVTLHYVVTLLVPLDNAQASSTLPLILLGPSLALLGISFFVRRLFDRRAAAQSNPRLAVAGLILALALTAAVSLFGVVTYFTAAWPFYWCYILLAFLVMLLHFPRRESF